MTSAERTAARKEARENFGSSLEDMLFENWGKILAGIAGIVVLIFIGLFVKAYLNNRVVR